MRNQNSNKQNKIEQRKRASRRLAELRQNAELVQREIETITEQIELLDRIITEDDTSSEQVGEVNRETEDRAVEVGDRVRYNKKAGKRLRESNAHNPRGTVTRITEHYIYIKTDDTGDIINRAAFNVSRI